jgi:hypothetical protein
MSNDNKDIEDEDEEVSSRANVRRSLCFYSFGCSFFLSSVPPPLFLSSLSFVWASLANPNPSIFYNDDSFLPKSVANLLG